MQRHLLRRVCRGGDAVRGESQRGVSSRTTCLRSILGHQRKDFERMSSKNMSHNVLHNAALFETLGGKISRVRSRLLLTCRCRSSNRKPRISPATDKFDRLSTRSLQAPTTSPQLRVDLLHSCVPAAMVVPAVFHLANRPRQRLAMSPS